MRLEPLTTLRVTLADILDLGDTQWGRRRVVPITGGEFTGDRLHGTVLAGGADWQVVHDDGMITVDTLVGPQDQREIEARPDVLCYTPMSCQRTSR
jgi:hypothetical protein